MSSSITPVYRPRTPVDVSLIKDECLAYDTPLVSSPRTDHAAAIGFFDGLALRLVSLVFA